MKISGINIILIQINNIYNWTCLLSSVIISVYYNRIENKTINCASYIYLLLLPSYYVITFLFIINFHITHIISFNNNFNYLDYSRN